VERPGGGGLGDPLLRSIANVVDDVRQGYVSAARARSDYRIAIRFIDDEPELDEAETQKLRGKN
jgi:N-methylhydantoinase B/oxoprolinase/acetone carboxylase alpha subunit